MEAMRWTLVCVIGVLTGLVAFMIDILVKKLFALKYGLLEKGLEQMIFTKKVEWDWKCLLFNCYDIISEQAAVSCFEMN